MIWRRVFAVDLRSLAAMRIGLASLLVADLIARAVDLEAHYTDLGVLPRSLLVHFPVIQRSVSVHALGGSAEAQVLLFLLAGLCAVALGVGYRTRVATVASWVLLVSLHNRNPMVLTGGDDLMRLLLFWSCFLPLGARASVDEHRAGTARATTPDDTHISLAGAALLLQVALVYPVAAIFKWRDPAWTGLEAIALTMSVEGVATGIGRSLLHRPEWLPSLTAGVLHFESWAAALAFLPDRRGFGRMLAVTLFVGFHVLVLGITLSIGFFPLVAATAWLAFLPASFWRLPPFAHWMPARAATSREHTAAVTSAPAQSALRFVVGAAGLCVLLHNAATLGWVAGGRLGPPGIVRTLTHTLRLDQRWSLWTTPPENRHYVYSAELADGRRVDLHREGAALDWQQPRRRCASNRWWKYKLAISGPAFAPLRPALASHVRQRAETDARLESEVVSLQLWMVLGSYAEVRAGQARRVRLWPSNAVPDESGGVEAPVQSNTGAFEGDGNPRSGVGGGVLSESR